MRLIMTLLMVVAVCMAVSYRGQNGTNAMYIADVFDYNVFQDNVGMFSVSESVNGADSVAIYFDVLTGTYDHYECYFWVSMIDENLDATSTLTGHVNIYPEGAYATATAADTLNWVNLHDSGDAFGKVYYTVTTDGTAHQVGALVPGETWESPCVIWVDGTAATDSTGFLIEAIASDSCMINITGLAIPQT